MSQISVIRTIDAPVDLVFQTISDIRNFSKAIPDIVHAEILSDVQTGVGTRFRETRLMKGREATTELEVTEYVENDRIRIVADSHGTVWDSVFTVKSAQGQTTLELTMRANAYKLGAKLANPLMKSWLTKALESDMEAVKTYCEKPDNQRT